MTNTTGVNRVSGFCLRCRQTSQAAHSRHLYVQQHQVRSAPREFFQRFVAVAGGDYLESLWPQQSSQKVAKGWVVINDQDSWNHALFPFPGKIPQTQLLHHRKSCTR